MISCTPGPARPGPSGPGTGPVSAGTPSTPAPTVLGGQALCITLTSRAGRLDVGVVSGSISR
ncbi:WSD1 family O-acyltransferase [Rhodococcus opacus]|nr:WSD1 family O-acyltransferase [Rhodococcus opacus]